MPYDMNETLVCYLLPRFSSRSLCACLGGKATLRIWLAAQSISKQLHRRLLRTCAGGCLPRDPREGVSPGAEPIQCHHRSGTKNNALGITSLAGCELQVVQSAAPDATSDCLRPLAKPSLLGTPQSSGTGFAGEAKAMRRGDLSTLADSAPSPGVWARMGRSDKGGRGGTRRAQAATDLERESGPGCPIACLARTRRKRILRRSRWTGDGEAESATLARSRLRMADPRVRPCSGCADTNGTTGAHEPKLCRCNCDLLHGEGFQRGNLGGNSGFLAHSNC